MENTISTTPTDYPTAPQLDPMGDLVKTFALSVSVGLGVSLSAASVVVLAGFVA